MPCQPVSGSTDSLSGGWKVGHGFSELTRYHAREVNSGKRVDFSRHRVRALVRYSNVLAQGHTVG